MSHLFAFSHPREHQLSGLDLSPSEAAGAIESSFWERRRHRLPQDWPSAVSRFFDRPCSSQVVPPIHHRLPDSTRGPQVV